MMNKTCNKYKIKIYQNLLMKPAQLQYNNRKTVKNPK